VSSKFRNLFASQNLSKHNVICDRKLYVGIARDIEQGVERVRVLLTGDLVTYYGILYRIRDEPHTTIVSYE